MDGAADGSNPDNYDKNFIVYIRIFINRRLCKRFLQILPMTALEVLAIRQVCLRPLALSKLCVKNRTHLLLVQILKFRHGLHYCLC